MKENEEYECKDDINKWKIIMMNYKKMIREGKLFWVVNMIEIIIRDVNYLERMFFKKGEECSSWKAKNVPHQWA